jgi:hypothetical protein
MIEQGKGMKIIFFIVPTSRRPTKHANKSIANARGGEACSTADKQKTRKHKNNVDENFNKNEDADDFKNSLNKSETETRISAKLFLPSLVKIPLNKFFAEITNC